MCVSVAVLNFDVLAHYNFGFVCDTEFKVVHLL